MPEVIEPPTELSWSWEHRCEDCGSLVRYGIDDLAFRCYGYNFDDSLTRDYAFVRCPTRDCLRSWDVEKADAPKVEGRLAAETYRRAEASRPAALAATRAANLGVVDR